MRIAVVGGAAGGTSASGLRSAIAHRILAQNGFASTSPSGGILTLPALLDHRAEHILRNGEALQHAA